MCLLPVVFRHLGKIVILVLLWGAGSQRKVWHPALSHQQHTWVADLVHTRVVFSRYSFLLLLLLLLPFSFTHTLPCSLMGSFFSILIAYSIPSLSLFIPFYLILLFALCSFALSHLSSLSLSLSLSVSLSLSLSLSHTHSPSYRGERFVRCT